MNALHNNNLDKGASEALNSKLFYSRRKPNDPSLQHAFTFLSYNVLAYTCVDTTRYHHCKPEDLQWKQRRELLRSELKEANADLIALQECVVESFYNQRDLQNHKHNNNNNNNTTVNLNDNNNNNNNDSDKSNIDDNFDNPVDDDFGSFLKGLGYDFVIQNPKKKKSKGKEKEKESFTPQIDENKNENEKVKKKEKRVGNVIIYKKNKFKLHYCEDRSRAIFAVFQINQHFLDKLQNHKITNNYNTHHTNHHNDPQTSPSQSDTNNNNDNSTNNNNDNNLSSNPSLDPPVGDENFPEYFPKPHYSNLIYIGNVHLEGHPLKCGERFNQIRSLLVQIQKRQEIDSPTIHPNKNLTIIAGDFNESYDSFCYDLLTRGELEGEYRDKKMQMIVTPQNFTHPFKFQSAYLPHQMQCTYMNAKYDSMHCVDFIYYSRDNLCVRGLMKSLGENEKEWNGEAFPIPNHTFPSDHFPIGCAFTIEKEKELSLRDNDKHQASSIIINAPHNSTISSSESSKPSMLNSPEGFSNDLKVSQPQDSGTVSESVPINSFSMNNQVVKEALDLIQKS